MQTVTVRGVWLPGHVAQVALWERDPRHPAGELMLTSGQIATVNLTRGVNDAIARGTLELVDEPPAPAEPEIAQAESVAGPAAKAKRK